MWGGTAGLRQSPVDGTPHGRCLGQRLVDTHNIVEVAQRQKSAGLGLKPCRPQATAGKGHLVPRGDQNPDGGTVEERDGSEVHREIRQGRARRPAPSYRPPTPN